MKVSMALEEVWRWKEDVSRETKNMTLPERIAYFRQANQRVADKIGRKLDLPRASRRK